MTNPSLDSYDMAPAWGGSSQASSTTPLACQTKLHSEAESQCQISESKSNKSAAAAASSSSSSTNNTSSTGDNTSMVTVPQLYHWSDATREKARLFTRVMARRSPNCVRLTNIATQSSITTTTSGDMKGSADDDVHDSEYWYRRNEALNQCNAREYYLGLPLQYRSIIRTILAISGHRVNGTPVYPLLYWHRLPLAIVLVIIEWSLPPLNESPLSQCQGHALHPPSSLPSLPSSNSPSPLATSAVAPSEKI
jgi:hypothetical protein